MESFVHVNHASLSKHRHTFTVHLSSIRHTVCVHTLYFLVTWRQEEVTVLCIYMGVGACGGVKRAQGY